MSRKTALLTFATLLAGGAFAQELPASAREAKVGRNASSTKPAKFLVLLVKDKNAPMLTRLSDVEAARRDTGVDHHRFQLTISNACTSAEWRLTFST